MLDMVLDAGLIEMNKSSFLCSKTFLLTRKETGLLNKKVLHNVISKIDVAGREHLSLSRSVEEVWDWGK